MTPGKGHTFSKIGGPSLPGVGKGGTRLEAMTVPRMKTGRGFCCVCHNPKKYGNGRTSPKHYGSMESHLSKIAKGGAPRPNQLARTGPTAYRFSIGRILDHGY